MKTLTLILTLFSSSFLHAQTMTITRAGSQPTTETPDAYFTGTAHVTPLFAATDATRAAGASVTFEAGARSAWHTHPRGQVLIVTSGVGRIQQWGEPIQEIRPGDVIWTPPGVKHWHGAAPSSAMTHIAIQEEKDGKVVEWMEKVSDEQYRSTRRSKDMSEPSTAARNAFGDIAPELAEITDEVLFDNVWNRPELSARDRSLITIAALMAGYRTNELPFHLKKALDNGVTKGELVEVITHLAFYSGWPTANTALNVARPILEDAE